MVPPAFVQLEEFPLTPSKKVDRKALPAPGLDDAVELGEGGAASTPTEQVLVDVWCSLLGLRDVGVHADFLDVGGYSLLGVRVIEEIDQRLGVRLKPADCFEYPTVSLLAARVDAVAMSGASSEVAGASAPVREMASERVTSVPADLRRVLEAIEGASSTSIRPSSKPFRMRESWIARFMLAPLYQIRRAFFRRVLDWLILKLEGGEAYTVTLRRLYSKHFDMEIGDYSTGAFDVGRVKRTTRIGRYSTLTESLRIETANHPANAISSHALFYVRALSFADGSEIPRNRVEIGNDVFIGHNATILYPTQKIGDGALIAAHAVVSEDVPPYAIVAGYPATIVRYRFSPGKIAQLLESRWWDARLEDLEQVKDEFTRPLEGRSVR
jgi:acetyltransferase-like isoleucine patch superfamily enzyme